MPAWDDRPMYLPGPSLRLSRRALWAAAAAALALALMMPAGSAREGSPLEAPRAVA